MEFEQTITIKDIENYNLFILDQKKFLKFYTIIISVIALIFAFYTAFSGLVVPTLLCSLIFIYISFLFTPIFKFVIKRRIRKNIINDVKINVTVNDDGLCYASDCVNSWDTIEKVTITNYYIYIMTKNGQLLMIKNNEKIKVEVETLFKKHITDRVQFIKHY